MRLVVLAAFGLAALSCGGGSASTSGSATFTGTTIRGQSLVPRDAIAANVSVNPNGVPGHAAVIGITSASGICSVLTSGKEPKSTQYLALTAFRLQPDFSAAPPPAPGMYSVGTLALENAAALFAATDANCQNLSPPGLALASSGTVTFTSVGNRYAGSFDLFFDFGEHVSGTFDAPVCPGLSEFAEGKGTLACQ